MPPSGSGISLWCFTYDVLAQGESVCDHSHRQSPNRCLSSVAHTRQRKNDNNKIGDRNMLQLDTAPSVSSVQSPAFRGPITRVDRPAAVRRPLGSQLRERLNSVEARLERAELAIHEWLVV